MSADNWRVCPKCLAKEEAKLQKLQQEADDVYGEVSKEEYLELRKKVFQFVIPECITFREDYEIYTDDRLQLTISYHGECTECDETKTFRYDESKQ